MALDKQALKQEIIDIQKEMMQKQESDFETYAERLSSAIERYVKSGQVVVNTTGTATAQTGTGTIQ